MKQNLKKNYVFIEIGMLHQFTNDLKNLLVFTSKSVSIQRLRQLKQREKYDVDK